MGAVWPLFSMLVNKDGPGEDHAAMRMFLHVRKLALEFCWRPAVVGVEDSNIITSTGVDTSDCCSTAHVVWLLDKTNQGVYDFPHGGYRSIRGAIIYDDDFSGWACLFGRARNGCSYKVFMVVKRNKGAY